MPSAASSKPTMPTPPETPAATRNWTTMGPSWSSSVRSVRIGSLGSIVATSARMSLATRCPCVVRTTIDTPGVYCCPSGKYTNDDRGIPIEASIPEAVTEDDDRTGAQLLAVGRAEEPSRSRQHPEHREVVSRDHAAEDGLGTGCVRVRAVARRHS